jgi:hypothetical protein
MATDTVTIAQFIESNRISLTAEKYTDHNPLMEGEGIRMDHWKVTLERGSRSVVRSVDDITPRRMTLTFSKGLGHHGAEPTAEEVLDCLASDASGIENARDFEDFCSEYGYDTDSRKAEKIYKDTKHQTERLRKFLGDEAFDTLVWNTERM